MKVRCSFRIDEQTSFGSCERILRKREPVRAYANLQGAVWIPGEIALVGGAGGASPRNDSSAYS